MSRKRDGKYLESILKHVKSLVAKPEDFLSVQEEKFKIIKDEVLKPLYDYTKKKEEARKSSALDELIVDGMDAEQIWQQLEIQNEESLQRSLEGTSEWLTIKDSLLEVLNESDQSDEEVEQEPSENQSSESEDENLAEQSEQSEAESEVEPLKPKKTYKSTIVDDQFFKLREMEEFLEQEDKKEFQDQKDSDSEEIDYFEDTDDDEEDQKGMKYTDFFDYEDQEPGNPEESEEEVPDEEIDENSDDSDEFDIGKLAAAGNLEESDDQPSDIEPEPAEKSDHEETPQQPREISERDKKFLAMSRTIPEEEEKPKSSFELRQEKFKEKIQKMEHEILDERPWQLKGEIHADSRPQNSLLEEILEFDMTTRPAPVITEETTVKLEDIIKQRIKDKAFDDVERKVKPTDHQYEYKKQLVLDQEKSKESLSKIYEKEYLKELEKLNPGAGDKDEEEEPKEHQEIRRKMKELFEKLDTLSSCFYTPKPAIPELKIITNLPTISMEEVAPVAVSDGNLLAPEEIKRRAIGDIIGKKERTKTDKNRERRKKKQFQKQKKVREEKSVAGKNNPKFQDKVDKEKMIRKVTKGRNVERMNESGADKASKSSKEFFNKLQDEVSNITQKIKSKKRKPEMGGFVAKKIKL